MKLCSGTSVYWRFKGEKAYHYGYPTRVERGMWRMGSYNGDTTHGVIVDPSDIELK